MKQKIFMYKTEGLRPGDIVDIVLVDSVIENATVLRASFCQIVIKSSEGIESTHTFDKVQSVRKVNNQ